MAREGRGRGLAAPSSRCPPGVKDTDVTALITDRKPAAGQPTICSLLAFLCPPGGGAVAGLTPSLDWRNVDGG